MVLPADGTESWTVLADDWAPVEPLELFLAHLTDQERSPNTVKAYAHDLKDYFGYLEGRGADWRRLRFDELAGFKPWLRLSPVQRQGGIAALPTASAYCAPSTVNRKVAAVTSFYEFHARHGVQVASVIRDASRPLTISRSSFRPFLVSAFLREDGRILQTYWTTGRGLDHLIATYAWLDLTAMGRQEGWDGMPDPSGKGLGWLRHHDRYDES